MEGEFSFGKTMEHGGPNIARAQKIGGLAPTPFFPITGVEVWCDADDGLHRLADGLRSMG